MQREELLQLLNDPIVCQVIYKIVQNGGRPLVPGLTAQPAESIASDAAKFAAARERIRRSMLKQQSSAEGETANAAPDNSANAGKPHAPAQPDKRDGLALTAEEEKLVAAVAADELELTPEEKAEERKQSLAEKLAVLRGSVQEKQEAEEAEAERLANKATHDDEYTFVIERKCPVCERMTRIIKCKSRMIAEYKDMDFCTHYKDFNPYLYSVVACEHCGFAAEERRFLGYMPNRTREKYRDYLAENDLKVEFTAERTVEEALAFCQLAILFNELADVSPNRRAGLYLTMAWIHRYNGDKEKDLECVQKAAELYDFSLSNERYPVAGMSDNTAMYLTGVLYYMVKNYEKSTQYLSRIIGSQTFRTEDPKTFAKARDLWQDLKAERQALNKEK